MSDRTLVFLIGIVIALMVVLVIMNYVKVAEKEGEEEKIGINEIRGMEIYHEEVPYTLNLNQQVNVAKYLNTATRFQPEKELKSPSNVEKILIYRFDNQEPLEITPVYYENSQLVFSAPSLSSRGLFMDNSKGKLQQILANAYDN